MLAVRHFHVVTIFELAGWLEEETVLPSVSYTAVHVSSVPSQAVWDALLCRCPDAYIIS